MKRECKNCKKSYRNSKSGASECPQYDKEGSFCCTATGLSAFEPIEEISCDNCKNSSKNNATKTLCNEVCGINNESFEPIEEKEYKLTEKYKDGFSLVDIAYIVGLTNCNEDGNLRIPIRRTLKNWLDFETFKNNLPWFIENGFIEEDKPAERWINIYYAPDEFAPTITKDGGCFYPTEDIARGYGKSKKGYITTIKLPDKEINK